MKKKEKCLEDNFYILKYKDNKLHSCVGPFNNVDTLNNNLTTMLMRENTFLNLNNKKNNALYTVAAENTDNNPDKIYKIIYLESENKEKLEKGLQKIENEIIQDYKELSDFTKVEESIIYKISKDKPKEKESNKYFCHLLVSKEQRGLNTLCAAKPFLECKDFNEAVNEIFFLANERSKGLIPKLHNSSFVINTFTSKMGEIQIVEKNDKKEITREVIYIFPEEIICNADSIFYN